MALPQNPQDFLCPGVEQPPITQYEPLAEGHPYGCIIINFYNGTQPITREIWIEGLLNVTQDVFDFCEWAVGWGSGTSFGTTAMFEILCKTHSPGENLPIAFSWYDYDVAGNLINTPSQTEFVNSFPKEFYADWVSWKLGVTTVDIPDITTPEIIGHWYALNDTLNSKAVNLYNSETPFIKFSSGIERNTLPIPAELFEVTYNGHIPDTGSSWEYGEMSGPGGGQGGSFDNSSDAVDFASLPSGGAAASGLISMFAPSAAQLASFGQFLWTTLFDGGFDSLLTSLKKWVNDPIESVIQLAAYPVTPPAGSATTLKFCGIRSDLVGPGVSMNKCTSQFMDFDFGQLKTPAYWKQTLDYSPYTQISIYLPYIGICPLKADDVIDATLHLKYHIDLLTGGFSAELKVTKNISGTPLNSVMYNWSGNMATQIPITSSNFSQVFGSMMTAVAAIGVGAITGGMGAAAAGGGAEAAGSAAVAGGALSGAGHGLAANIGNVINSKPHVTQSGRLDGTVGALSQFTPYLIIERPVQSLSSKFQEEQGYPSNIVQRLGDLSGMTVCEAPIMTGFSGATEEEKDAIRALLCGGVIL